MAIPEPPPFDPAASAADEVRREPRSLEAEQAVLGGLLVSNDAFDKVIDRLSEDDFYKKDHRLIYAAIADLNQDNQPCDALTVAERLKNKGYVDGMLAYLAQLAQAASSAANIVAYADIVSEKSIRRRLIRQSVDIADQAYKVDKSGKELLEYADKNIFELLQKHIGQQPIVDLSVAGERSYERIAQLHEQGGGLTGLSTGFSTIDSQTLGLQKGDLIIIAGRPSMGKTSLLLNLIEYIAMDKNHSGTIAFFSMEMQAEQLALRFLSSLSGIDQLNLRRGKLEDNEWPRLGSAYKMLSDFGKKVFIDDSATLNPGRLRARTRSLVRERGELALIAVDYLQMMTSDSSRHDNRTLEISEISRSLKSLAREMNVPLIALSQLSRAVEQRADKRPIMSDLRESGAIEQDADVIIFIYRDDVYDKEDGQAMQQAKDMPVKAEIHVAKQRNGPQFMRQLMFTKSIMKFSTPIDEDRIPSYDKNEYMAGSQPVDIDDITMPPGVE